MQIGLSSSIAATNLQPGIDAEQEPA